LVVDAAALAHVAGARAARFVTAVDGASEPVVARDCNTGAGAVHAAVVRRAGLRVVACRAVRRAHVFARARLGIALAGDVAVVCRLAGDRLGADALAGLTRIRLRAGVRVVAGRTVFDRLDEAFARDGVAHGHQTRTEIVFARFGGTGTNPGKAGVFARQRIAVVAAVPIRP